MSRQKNPISMRLSDELEARLEAAVERLGIKKQTLAQMAVEAAVEAIEKNDFRLVVPVKFEVTHVAVARTAPGPVSTFPPPSTPEVLNDRTERQAQIDKNIPAPPGKNKHN
jgi:predicted DNA-binding protein